jgi:colicin import membrane protein
MSEEKESSVLFSLKELMNIEEDRIKGEEADKAARANAAERSRADAERAAREAEEARIRAEEERRRQEEQRAREEAARLAAIQVAEVERARLEAEQKARLEAMNAQQAHERSLAALHQDKSKKNLRNMLIGGTAFVLIGGGLAGYFAYDSHQKQQAAIAAQEQQRQILEEEKKKLEEQARQGQENIAKLNDALANAKDDAQRLALQKQLADEQARQDALKKPGSGAARPTQGGPSGAPKAPCNCAPGDPLCSCL